jgi:hypothetical protein
MTDGGLREAVIRSLLYVGMPRASIDERGFEMARRIRQTHGELSLADFKMLVREQFYMLVLDERAAVDALAGLLPTDLEKRRAGLSLIRQILGARGDLSAEEEKRFGEIARIFGVNEESSSDERSTREATETGVVRRIAS